MNHLIFDLGPGGNTLFVTFQDFRRECDPEFLRRLNDIDDPLNVAFDERLQQKLPGLSFSFTSQWECEITHPKEFEYGEVAFIFYHELQKFTKELKDTEDDEFWHPNFVRQTTLNGGTEYQRTLFNAGNLTDKQRDHLKTRLDQKWYS